MRRYRLTSLQETILLTAMNEPGRYLSVIHYRLSDKLDEQTIRSRLTKLAGRHEALRSIFIRDENGVFWHEVTDNIDDGLFKIEIKGNELTVKFHHALLDGWSINNIMRELVSEDITSDKPSPFRYYIKWYERQDHAANLSWWKEYLDGVNSCLPLPYAKNTTEYKRCDMRFILPNSKQIRECSRELKITAGRLIQAVWSMLMARYNNGEAIVCTVTNGRSAPVPGITGMVGNCLNTLPILTRLPKPPESVSFSDWVSGWAKQTTQAEKLGQSALGDLINTMPYILVIEPPNNGNGYEFISSKARLITDFDIVITLSEDVDVRFLYNAFAYSHDVMITVKNHFLTALNAVLENPQIAMDKIPVLTVAEIEVQTKISKNEEILDIVNNKTSIHLFHESANKYAQRTALVYGNVRITYKELYDKTIKLASLLKSEGVGTQTPVAMLMERSERIVIAQIAVLIAGGFPLLLDTSWPTERIRLILDEVKPLHVMDDNLYNKLTSKNAGLSCASSYDVSYPNPADTAYMIMTSGTTGVPKGVILTHRNILNYFMFIKKLYNWQPEDSTVIVYGFAFDASLDSTWAPLISGSTIHILPDDIRFNINKLGEYFKAERITIAEMPIKMIENFREIFNENNALPDLRLTITGGEEVRRVVAAPYPLLNLYGPTECSMACTFAWVNENDAPIPIGMPVANMHAYVLDEWGQLCPDGVIGEGYFAGVGVTRGYFNAPELTKEKYLKNPFSGGDPDFDIMYKTGDLMKWIKRNGQRELCFCGRADRQVKVNGFRVELGEIENVLMGHPSIRAVTAQFLEKKHLCAYVVTDGPVELSELDAQLASKLPAFMLPRIIFIDEIPLNANGKVDLGHLPLPAQKMEAMYVAPVTEAETVLTEAIMKILDVESVGTNHNFIFLGGNSISAMRIVFHLEQKGFTLENKILITSATLAEAAAQMRVISQNALQNISISHNTFIPSPAQQAMYFLTQTAGPQMYAITMKLDAPDLTERELSFRLKKAMELHDILRTTYELNEDGQVVGHVHDIDDLQEPVVKCVLENGILTIDYHHISLDGWSINMLVDELLYNKFPDTAPSFAEFSNRLASQADKQAEDEKWWQEECKNTTTVPLFSPKKSSSYNIREINIPLPDGLKNAAHNAGVTKAAFTLTAWGVFLTAFQISDGNADRNTDEKIFIETVASNRDDENLMGLCGVALPVPFSLKGNTFGELARYTQNMMQESMSHYFVPQDIIGNLPSYLFLYEDNEIDYIATGEQNYNLVVQFSEILHIHYNTACIDDSFASGIVRRLIAILTSACDDKISIYFDGEYESVTQKFAHGRALDVRFDTASEAFLAATEQYANNVALETDSKMFTYSQLYELAKQHKKMDVMPICSPRNENAIIMHLGAALSGSAFLPIDPEWPEERRNKIIKESQTGVIPDDTAYILYTSGTTGTPKGAVLPQAALVNQIVWAIDEFGFGPDDRVLHYVNYTFDPSVWTIFATLCSGATLVLTPEHIRLDPAAVAKYIIEKKITVCILPATIIPEILHHVGNNSKLRLAFFGGEVVKNLPPERTYEAVNLYGPTEACVNTSFYRLKADETATSNIGKPVANTACYILDARRNPSPIDIPGDLYIGGVQLAFGYHNHPVETAAAFITHPEFGRLYRTGDRAMWHSDGTLEFLGRSDRQIKIRGNRVELGEIEKTICLLPGVEDAKVIFRDNVLDAYVTGDAAAADVRQMLGENLPVYMLPRSVTVLESFPLNENGKVDYDALPEYMYAGGRSSLQSPVQTPTEKIIAEAWKTAIGLAPDYIIAPNDNFYDLGGHSLLLFHVVGLLAKEGFTAPINTLIEYPVLRDLAVVIGDIAGDKARNVRPCIHSSKQGNLGDYEQYVERMEQIDLTEKRKFHNVLITGGTGFLGSHLIRELYMNTDAMIYLPVRGDNKRLQETLKYYFGESGIKMAASNRLHVIKADLSEKLPSIDIALDVIYHTAADIRHYAPEKEMYSANVTATENMITLAQEFPGVLFAHISTTSAVNYPVIYETSRILGPRFNNLYQRTKQIAEQRVMDAGEKGLKYEIFRVGHISPGYIDGSVARNWEINAMLRLINSMLLTGLLPEQDYEIGFGYVDKVAETIRLLSEPVQFNNLIFHIDNPKTQRLSELFKLAGLSGTVMKKEELINRLEVLSESGNKPVRQAATEYLGRFAQGSIEFEDPDVAQGKLHMDATLLLLEKLGFQWPHVTKKYLQNIINSIYSAQCHHEL